jgi:hypothetical protein
MNTQEPDPQEGQAPPSEEELQARLEEQLRKVRVQDLLLESVASILNLSARRIAKPDERDLDQARVGIEAVRAVLDLLEPAPREQVREALSQVQVLYAREAGGSAAAPDEESAATPSGDEPGAPGPGPEAPGPDRPSGLWTPPGA